jgi:hypothetical protein
MPHYEDRGDEGIIYVPVDDIQGEKTMGDGSTRFKFIGGPYHGMIFRVYPPYDTVWWPDGVTYELSPPLNIRKSNKWKYVHNPTLRNGVPYDL